MVPESTIAKGSLYMAAVNLREVVPTTIFVIITKEELVVDRVFDITIVVLLSNYGRPKKACILTNRI